MFNFDYITKEDIKEHNPSWPDIFDHPYRILIDEGSGSRKTNAFLNLINHNPDIDNTYLYAKDPHEAKYQLLINKRKRLADLKYSNNSKSFIEYSNDMDNIDILYTYIYIINHELDIDKIYLYDKDSYEAKYQLLINKSESTDVKYLTNSKSFNEYSNEMDDIYKIIEEYNPNKERKILIVFDDMVADMLSNKNLNPVVTELFIRGRKLNNFLVFITQSYLDQIISCIRQFFTFQKESFTKNIKTNYDN